MKRSDSKRLPDGGDFSEWRPVLRFSKSLYVDQRAAYARDDGPGTIDRPFRTISRAAQVADAGTRVVVRAGLYREHVPPAGSGTAPDRMVSYQVEPRDRVVVRGSEVLESRWVQVGRSGQVWRIDLGDALPGRDWRSTPVARTNLVEEQLDFMGWARDRFGIPPFSHSACLLFQSGRRLSQVSDDKDGVPRVGIYWVDRAEGTLYAIPFARRDPNSVRMELTVRPQVFAPTEIGLQYVHVRGFTFEHAGNPFPMPQYGAVSTTRGTRWFIEGNVIRRHNSVGVDIGNQCPTLPQPPVTPSESIVRGNTISECGISGLQGLVCIRGLIEENRLAGNAFHDAERTFESAAIKTHMNDSTLIRNNVITGTRHGSGIWIDARNRNTRITGNVVTDTRTDFGAIFVEISDQPNLIDRNLIWGTRGAGIYEHDTQGQIFRDNVIANTRGPAIALRGAQTGRDLDGRTIIGGGHTVSGNQLYGNTTGVEASGPDNRLSRNRESHTRVALDRATWDVVLEKQ